MSADAIRRVPGAWPLVGHAPHLLRDPLAFLRSLPAHGDLVEVRIATQKVVVVCDPGLTRLLLTSDRVFDKGGAMFDRLREVLGNGIGSCPHADHRRQRRAVQPAFSPSRIPAYGDVMTTQCRRTVDSWRDGQCIDVPRTMLDLTAGITITALFSGAVTAGRRTEALKDVRTVMAGIYRRILTPAMLDALPTPGRIRYDRAGARLHHTTRKVIAEHRATAAHRDDLLALIVTQDPADVTALADAEIEDQVLTFLLAGIETSANALAWTLYLLAGHPRIQNRLHEELDTVLAGRPATVADLPRLRLTGRVITESLRLYPPGWLFTRTTTADTRLAGKPIPAGSIVAYSPYILHHRPDVVTEPDRFVPDRWADHTSALAPRGPIIPFGAGPRKCIGDTFAMTEMCIALATIGARFTLRPVTDRPARPALNMQLRPRKLRLRLEARTRTGFVSNVSG
jgi:cytochrome P450